MTWEPLVALASMVVTGGIGFLTYLRGRRSDQALNVATNVQAAFDANQQLIDALQEDISTQRQWLHSCEEACRSCRQQLQQREADMVDLHREIGNLKLLATQQEQTIAQHQRTLDAISRRRDHPTPPTLAPFERRPLPETSDDPADD